MSALVSKTKIPKSTKNCNTNIGTGNPMHEDQRRNCMREVNLGKYCCSVEQQNRYENNTCFIMCIDQITCLDI